MRSYILLLTFMMPTLIHASNPVQYWTISGQQDWLALSCQQDGGGRLTVLDARGQTAIAGYFCAHTSGPAQDLDFFQVEASQLPVSPWWNNGVTADSEEQAATHHSPLIRLKTGDGAWQLTSPAPNGGIAYELRPLATSVELETSLPLLQQTGLRFTPPGYHTLESKLNAMLTEHALAHEAALRSEEANRPELNGRSAYAKHELRLLHLSQHHCAALILTLNKRPLASYSTRIAELNLQRIDGEWQTVDPLADISDPLALTAQIRGQLNRADADRDFFAKQQPNPLLPAARSSFSTLGFEQTLWLVFEPYVVAAGARGVIAIPVNRPLKQ